MNCSHKFIVIEPFYGGSHKQLIDLIFKDLQNDVKLVTLTDKKWHWKARVSALKLSQLVCIFYYLL